MNGDDLRGQSPPRRVFAFFDERWGRDRRDETLARRGFAYYLMAEEQSFGPDAYGARRNSAGVMTAGDERRDFGGDGPRR